MKGVGWLARALAWLLPRADIVFVLDAPPELIHARKPELTIPELARQSAVLRQLSETRRNWQLVDASQSPEAVARETIAAVLEKIRFRQ
jgi:thymidylate kinase